jgi:hypothetical protein
MVIMIPSLDAVLDSIYRCAAKKASHTQDVTHGQYLYIYIYTLYIVYCIYIILDTWLSKCQEAQDELLKHLEVGTCGESMRLRFISCDFVPNWGGF